MIAQKAQGPTGGALTVDLVPLPGEVAFRVTIQPSPSGCAWSTDASPLLGAPEPVQPLAPAAPDNGPNTHALDEIFSQGL